MFHTDEKGSALLTVLLMISIIFIFGAVLASSAISGMKQTKMSERDIQAIHLAEMGIAQFRKNPSQSLNSTGPFYINGKDPASATALKYSYQFENVSRDTRTGFFSLTSAGTSHGITRRIDVSGTLYDGNTPPCDGPFAPDCYVEEDAEVSQSVITGGDMTVCNKANLEIKNGSLFVGEMLYLSHNAGGANSSSIIVEENAYFRSGITMLQQNSLIVKGDAYFYNPYIDLKGSKLQPCPPEKQADSNGQGSPNVNKSGNGNENGNKGLVCVEGTLFYPEGEELLERKTLAENTTCGSLGPGIERGIFARSFEAIPPDRFPDFFKEFPLVIIEEITYQ
ncbi:hypothetical protein [Bacillus marinisedimentorum]|uniref:hypothetical protein n=1 Tax=Bacillus marinisedimentorum TaxID=1821260 RepID=UPI000872BE58|nr:hypothetical protein [Bacillus marinisedimentorum]